ncbi:hypothetical protein LCGC14_2394060 [marine sediment metagenome]|uniref:Uncharacterized protein n=1 Tax=marine sediment metagenome TaxID=412755 RepID=A0A0F9BXB0_9ZZZZ
MSIGDLPKVVTATDSNGRVYEITLDDDPIKVGIIWAKVQELINCINNLEEKLLSGEEINKNPENSEN